MFSESPLTGIQRKLLHEALKDVQVARARLKNVRLLQRYTGQPKLVAATEVIEEHLQRLWHLMDGLDTVKPDLGADRSRLHMQL